MLYSAFPSSTLSSAVFGSVRTLGSREVGGLRPDFPFIIMPDSDDDDHHFNEPNS